MAYTGRLGIDDSQPGNIELGLAAHDTNPQVTGSDSLSITDVVTRVVSLFRGTSDSLTITDSVVAVRFRTTFTGRLGIDLSMPANIELGAVEAGHDTTPDVSTSDSLTISDAVTRLLNLFRSTSDSLTISDVAVALKVIPRTATDSLSITDVVTANVISGSGGERTQVIIIM